MRGQVAVRVVGTDTELGRFVGFMVRYSLLVFFGIFFSIQALAQFPGLEPVHVSEVVLPGDTVHTVEITHTPGDYLLQVENLGIDVNATVSVDGVDVLRTGSWRYREASQKGVFPLNEGETASISIFGVDRFAPPGRVIVEVSRIDNLDAFNPRRLAALRDGTQGLEYHLQHYFDGVDQRRRAVELLESAVADWNALGDAAEAAYYNFELGVLRRDMGDYREGEAALRESLRLFRSLNDQAGAAAAMNALGLLAWRQGRLDAAEALYLEARALRLDRGESFFAAEIDNNLGLIARDEGNLAEAIAWFENVLDDFGGRPLLQSSYAGRDAEFLALLASIQDEGGESPSLLYVLNNLSISYAETGAIDEALITRENSLALARALGNTIVQARYTVNQALLLMVLNNYGEALALLNEVIEPLRAPGNEYWLALALDAKGQTHAGLGEYESAREFHEAALRVESEGISLVRRLSFLTHLANSRVRLGELNEARYDFERLLAIAEQTGSPLRMGQTLVALGDVLRSLGELEEAERRYLQAHEQLASVHRLVAGRALARAGRVLLERNEPAAAEARLRAALAIHRDLSDRESEAFTLSLLADASKSRDRDEALALSSQAISVLESIRADIAAPGQREGFFRGRREIYEKHIGLLLENGRIEESWLASERVRARSFADLLFERAQSAGADAADGMLAQRSRLLRAINAKALLLSGMDAAVADEERQRELRREVRRLEEDLQVLEGSMRRDTRAGRMFDARDTVSLAQVQALLDDETLVAQYLLGDEESHVWLMTRDGLEVVELASAAEIGAAAEAVVGLMERPGNMPEKNQALERLARLVLAPLGDRLRHERLVVVPDGVLSAVPFSALPDPAAEGAPLLLAHELSYAPSASVLHMLGQSAGSRARTAGIAIVADPVFEPGDARAALVAADDFAPAPDENDFLLASAARRSGIGTFRRLAGSGREARFIAEGFAAGNTLLATGFDANRELVTSGRLREFQVLHFATHGIVDTEQPYLSGIVLSRFDEDLRPRGGFLRALDISYLDLGADLVVLSACETAAGQSIKGEGTLGLTRSFFIAGARQVISSLWQVSDRATADLMSLFYEEARVAGMPTARALQRAKVRLIEDTLWRDPYYWAGFVAQGDWRVDISR